MSKKIKYLELKEVKAIIKGIKLYRFFDYRDKAIIETLFSTGLRVSELCALPDAPFVSVTGSTLELSIIGKGGYARTVYFSPKALIAIKAYLKKREKLNSVKHLEARLFPLSPRAVEYIIKKRGLVVGIQCHPHTFRHSFATYVLGQTGNLRLVQELCGHRSISSTQIYAGITNKQLKEAHQNLFK